jgi:hypothetical protein
VAHGIERIFEQDNAAFVTHKCLTKEGMEFRNTEFFTFDGERIKTHAPCWSRSASSRWSRR